MTNYWIWVRRRGRPEDVSEPFFTVRAQNSKQAIKIGNEQVRLYHEGEVITKAVLAR